VAQSNPTPAVATGENGVTESFTASATPSTETPTSATSTGPAPSTAVPGVAGAVNPQPNAPAEKKGANAADFHAAGPTPESTSKGAAVVSAGAAKKANGAAKNSKKKAAAAEPVEAPVEVPIPDDAPVVPAKLLKAASPVYPPDAMNNFITGDVKLKAEVDEKGHIWNIEVISGPAALRPAAMEAMKQFEYAPATKGGRGISSQVKVTIKFWFDP
jgi:TonB family protein